MLFLVLCYLPVDSLKVKLRQNEQFYQGSTLYLEHLLCLQVNLILAPPEENCFYFDFSDSTLFGFEFLPADRTFRLGNKSNFEEFQRPEICYIDAYSKLINSSVLSDLNNIS